MLIDYQNDVDRSLHFTSKSTLVEHYKEQSRANTVMGFVVSLIIAFVGILNFVNSMVTAIVSRQKEFAMITSNSTLSCTNPLKELKTGIGILHDHFFWLNWLTVIFYRIQVIEFIVSTF